MYSEENSAIVTTITSCPSQNVASISKDTLQLSPHIAAHKSSLTCIPGVSLGMHSSLSSKSDDLMSSESYEGLSPQHQSDTSYHFSIPSLAHSLPNGNKLLETDECKSSPQDLSPASNKETIPGLDITKPLQQIHFVINQGIPIGTSAHILPSAHISDKTCLVPGTIFAVGSVDNADLTRAATLHSVPQLQVSTTAVSSVMSLPVSTATIATPLTSNPSDNILTENDMIVSDIVNEHDADAKHEGEIEKDELPTRDLVKQAVQAAFAQTSQPSSKCNNDQEMIEYNFSAGDIAELLMLNTSVQGNIKAVGHTAALFNAGAPLPSISLTPSLLSDPSSANQVVLLQPAAVEYTASDVVAQTQVKRKKNKLSEEEQLERKTKLAVRMKEKRLRETDDQKLCRRNREAERMRRKRASENEDQKAKRRRDAAERARLRRSVMTEHEKAVDREKAAHRMKLLRKNESEQQKKIRRIKAANRMRLRRSQETPEQKLIRKQRATQKIKVFRKKKDDDDNVVEPCLSSSDSAVQGSYQRLSCAELGLHKGSVNDSREKAEFISTTAFHPDDISVPSHSLSHSPHIVVSSGIAGEVTLLHVNTTIPLSTIPTEDALYSTVDASHIVEPLPLNMKTIDGNTLTDEELVKCSPPRKLTCIRVEESIPTVEASKTLPSSHDQHSPHIPQILQYQQLHSYRQSVLFQPSTTSLQTLEAMNPATGSEQHDPPQLVNVRRLSCPSTSN